MDKTTIFHLLQKIESEVSKLNNTIFALKTTDMEKYGENYEELSENAALKAEKITCQLRKLIQLTDFNGTSAYMQKAVTALGIKISYEERILSVTLPGLFPQRKLHANTAFLRDPLHYALKEFLKNHSIEQYKNCAICFCLAYDRRLPSRRIKDYDNLELKLVLDVISTYVLLDDSGLYCDAHYTTELGDCDQTVIYIMEKKCFPEWLKAHEEAKNTLSENP